ncbi:hypothetical protein DENSPDRAFT_844282 [Dentipellis sp. KUC8613]|nr:hypothetical protein DENSPDRAFT_844282 [Dentipellis sp. KUC8613]
MTPASCVNCRTPFHPGLFLLTFDFQNDASCAPMPIHRPSRLVRLYTEPGVPSLLGPTRASFPICNGMLRAQPPCATRAPQRSSKSSYIYSAPSPPAPTSTSIRTCIRGPAPHPPEANMRNLLTPAGPTVTTPCGSDPETLPPSPARRIRQHARLLLMGDGPGYCASGGGLWLPGDSSAAGAVAGVSRLGDCWICR